MERQKNNREEHIELTIETKGIFKILRPVFTNDELFDSDLLEDRVNSLINDGERNIIIDLSNVDYLYSDSINTLIELNHRIINVWGRIALYSPNENLSKILDRSGIKKFLNIYSDENEIENATSKIIEQTSALNTNDVKNYKPEKEQKVSQQVNNPLSNSLSIQQLVQNSSRDLALFELQSFKESLNSFCKDVLNPLIKKITKIEEKFLSETNITEKISEESPLKTAIQKDKSEEDADLKTTLEKDKLSEKSQDEDEEDDIQRIFLDETPDSTNSQKEGKTPVDSDENTGSEHDEEFYLEDNA